MENNNDYPKLPPFPIFAFTAKLYQRAIAFILDLILALTFTLMFLSTIIIPQKYSEPMHELQSLLQNYQNTPTPSHLPPLSQPIQEMLTDCQLIAISIIWAYFLLNELLLKGSSIGKKLFSLHSVNANTLQPLTFVQAILRSGFKTFSLITLFPFFLLNYLIPFFNKKKQAGHDLLTNSIVVLDIPLKDPDDYPQSNE